MRTSNRAMSRPNMIKRLRRIERELLEMVDESPSIEVWGRGAADDLEQDAREGVDLALTAVARLWDVRWKKD